MYDEFMKQMREWIGKGERGLPWCVSGRMAVPWSQKKTSDLRKVDTGEGKQILEECLLTESNSKS